MRWHIIAFGLGFVLDLLLGDPPFLPHPVRWIGRLITWTERWLRGERIQEEAWETTGQEEVSKELRQSIWLVVIVAGCTCATAACVLLLAYLLHPWVGIGVEAVMTYQLLAAKCLRTESMKVCRALKAGDLGEARRAVSMIVGRDTGTLDGEKVAKAAIETVAENTSDGVIAPMLYLALGGPVLGFFYKAVNTMDSMVGYKNESYLYFGRAAARLDDVVNFMPARVSAYLMLAAAFLGGRRFSGIQAYRVYRRDRNKHASPNSAQTESVCAGALGLQLAGDAYYFGRLVRKPYIGDKLRRADAEDIRLANRLMYMSAWMCAAGCLAVMTGLYFAGQGM